MGEFTMLVPYYVPECNHPLKIIMSTHYHSTRSLPRCKNFFLLEWPKFFRAICMHFIGTVTYFWYWKFVSVLNSLPHINNVYTWLMFRALSNNFILFWMPSKTSPLCSNPKSLAAQRDSHYIDLCPRKTPLSPLASTSLVASSFGSSLTTSLLHVSSILSLPSLFIPLASPQYLLMLLLS